MSAIVENPEKRNILSYIDSHLILEHILHFHLQGYLVNWEIEKQVWEYMFGKDVLKVCGNQWC